MKSNFIVIDGRILMNDERGDFFGIFNDWFTCFFFNFVNDFSLYERPIQTNSRRNRPALDAEHTRALYD